MKVQKEVITNEVVKFDNEDLTMILDNIDLKYYIIENNIGFFDMRGMDLYDDFVDCVIFSNFDKDHPVFQRARENQMKDYNIIDFLDDLEIDYVDDDFFDDIEYDYNFLDCLFNKKGRYNAYHNIGIDNIDDYKNMIDNLNITETLKEKLVDEKVIEFIDDVILLSKYVDDFKDPLCCDWFIEMVIDDMIYNEFLEIDLDKFNELTKKEEA